MFIQFLSLDRLKIKRYMIHVSLQLYFKRVNVPTVSKARWKSIPYCWSSMEKGSIAKSLLCHLRDYKQCFIHVIEFGSERVFMEQTVFSCTCT